MCLDNIYKWIYNHRINQTYFNEMLRKRIYSIFTLQEIVIQHGSTKKNSGRCSVIEVNFPPSLISTRRKMVECNQRQILGNEQKIILVTVGFFLPVRSDKVGKKSFQDTFLISIGDFNLALPYKHNFKTEISTLNGLDSIGIFMKC